ncbi:hypothetical protein MPTK1_5g18920 [Marchantia polymorpha subsp. ruderalis]|uniref:Transmembrane protein n=2 Tax=Marchantia polymorpha TaxID=3197 RepID=A0AAF6BJW6_MARPO|nr:hypothetical protein MARPO_0073s0050 [Marchantia polymorpha]BBN12300.1 hypothetical protein Mp_5g18920 [Marchantia polymorpha subsp. ruderalis]|eukprot:PTQ35176.1 hypothetical protein MARPO_0073s0050 [Marchantia polymorpha]
MEFGRADCMASSSASSSNSAQLHTFKSKALPRIRVASFYRRTDGLLEKNVEHLSSNSLKGGIPTRRGILGTSFLRPNHVREVSGLGLKVLGCPEGTLCTRRSLSAVCKAKNEFDKGSPLDTDSALRAEDHEGTWTLAAQAALWAVAGIYVLWLFILPYAPGDPAWAISPSTLQMLIDLSLNFFFVLPLTSLLADTVGIHGLAPVLHPMDEGLFNLVIGWTLVFAPLLFTDRRRDRLGGSLEGLWLVQMFLTNTVLAPYMAIRLNRMKTTSTPVQSESPRERRLLIINRVLTRGAKYVGFVGAAVGILSLVWALYGRPEGGFGGIDERWTYLVQYVGRERLAYAFVWDICLYCVFQPWLIGDNLSNVRADQRDTVRVLRFVPYVGLVAYALALRDEVKDV